MSTRRPVADKARKVARYGVFGITLVELLVFIVIVSVGLAGVLAVFNTVVRRSADPLIAKQMTAIAEALLEEVQLMPFTLCDPDDAHAATATTNTVNPADPTQCASLPEAMGPEAGEARGNAVTPFDNVNDYSGPFLISPVTDIAGNAMPGVAGYSASIEVSQAALDVVPGSESLLITVTVTGPGGQTFALSGFRTRYAPRAVP
jgi:MSHA pilin protein MshD